MRLTKNLLLACLLVFALPLLLFNCRRIDRFDSPPAPANAIEKFFKTPVGTKPVVVAISQNMQRQEQHKPFVNGFVQWAGFPNWDKAVLLASPSNALQRTTDGEGEIVVIPFANDGEEKTSALVIANLTETDTTYQTLYKSQYKSAPYETGSSSGLTAEQLGLLFMGFDKLTYGTSWFFMKDSALFHYAAPRKQHRYIDMENDPVSSRFTIVLCIDVYEGGGGDDCTPQETPHPGFNPCGIGVKMNARQICVTIDFGNGGIGGNHGGTGGTGGGSGNTGGGWNDNPCKSIGTGNPCDGNGGGWIPIILPDPCTGVDNSSGASATLQYANYTGNVSQFTPFDLSTTQQPEEYFIVNDVNGSYVAGSIQASTTSGGPIQGVSPNTVMVFHTHTFGGFPFPSAADFFALAAYGTSFQRHYVIGYNGTKYAMVVNSYSQLQAYVADNPNSIANDFGFEPRSTVGTQSIIMRNRLIDQGYSIDEAYERTLAFLMKQAGVTLVKAQANSNIFKKIGLQQKKNADGSPAVNASGIPIYENADCP